MVTLIPRTGPAKRAGVDSAETAVPCGPMDVVVAWLALALAASSFAWQILEARRRRATRVDIEVQHIAVPESVPDGPELLALPGVGHDDHAVIWPAERERLNYVLVVSAVNRGDSAESLLDTRIRSVDDEIAAGANPGGAGIELRARDRVPWAFRIDHAWFDLADGFYADAVLGSGVVRSGPHFLDDAVAEHIDKHNRALARGQP